jgi:hypothetical protein
MTSLISDQPLEEFIRDKLHDQTRDMAVGIAEDTLWYIGNMLATFVESKQLFVQQQNQTLLPTLAFLYRDAHLAQSSHERMGLLRKLGDTALFIGAIFPERFQSRGIGKDYFVGMGGGAYSYLADNFPTQKPVFSELSGRFPQIVRLVSWVCAKELAFDAQDILALYERWLSTNDELIKRQLVSLGIVPFDAPNSTN